MKNLDLKKLYTQGVRLNQAERAEEEALKRGILRAGNSGIKDADGIHGSCPRLAWLRSEGIEVAPPDDKLLMFTSGFANEDDWVSKLERSWHGKILQEEETPIKWETDSGYVVSGRPDIVLCGNDHKPSALIELKSIQSFWTVRGVILQQEPRISHLAQAAHYMWQLGQQAGGEPLPGYLLYTNQTNRLIPWKYKEEFEGTRFTDERTMNVVPFHYQYDLDIREGVLYYRPEHGEWTETVVTVEGIKAFYEAVGEMAQTKTLPPRPTSKNATGSAAYSPCKYCSFSDVCDNQEDNSFETWFDHAILRSKDL